MIRAYLADRGGVCRVPYGLRSSAWRGDPHLMARLFPGVELEEELERDRIGQLRLAEARGRWLVDRLVSGGRRWDRRGS